MRRSTSVTAAALSFPAFSAILLLLTYSSVTDALPISDTESFVLLSFGIVYGLTASWSLITMIGILRLRPWARIAALWLGAAAGLVYFLPLGWHICLVVTSRDVVWSWESVIPLPAFFALAGWWLWVFTRPGVKHQFDVSGS